jgi:hypothetical protein
MELQCIDRGTIRGKRVYRVDCIIDSHLREPLPSRTDKIEPEEEEKAEEIDASASNISDGDPSIVTARWRLISCVMAWPQTGFPLPQLIDYGHNNGAVLRQAVQYINKHHPDLLWNHSLDSKDIAGYVRNAEWEDSEDIPSGVNAELVVDERYDHKAATGLRLGILRSGSIGVSMDITPSHPDLDFDEFLARQGETINGEIVRWLPKKMFAVRHMALVPAGTGADKHAGMRNSHTISENKDKKMEEHKMNHGEVLQKILDSLKIDSKVADEGNGEEILTAVQEKLQSLNATQAKQPERIIEAKRMNHGEVLQRVVDALNIDYTIADADVGESVIAAIDKKLNALFAIREKHQIWNEALYALGKKLFNSDFTIDDVLDSFDLLYELAEQGKQLVNVRRREALEWFDKAHVDVLDTEPIKRLRSRIEQIDDVGHLEDMISEYKAIAASKFELNRTSADTKTEEPEVTDSDIQESANRLFN